MGKATVWQVELNGKPAEISCELKGNKYLLYRGDDHLTNVYRLSPGKMRYGLEEEIMIGSKRCLFVVLDEIPDLVIDGRMIHRNTDYAAYREKRRSGWERVFTVVAILGVLLLFTAVSVALLVPLSREGLEGCISMLMCSVWLIGVGLFYRGKWIEQIP